MDIQSPGPQKFREVTERGLTSFSAFLHVFPELIELLSTNMTWPTESMGLCMNFFLKIYIYSTHLAMHLLQWGSRMNSYIYLVGCVMFVE